VAYGTSMRLLLWLVFGLGFSFGTLFLSLGLVAPLAYTGIALAVLGVIAVQSVRLTVRTARIAVHAAPFLKWVLSYLYKPLGLLAQGVGRLRQHDVHSGLYEKEDFLALVRQQRDQVDNRMAGHELDIVERALQFDDRQAADVYLPMSRVRMVRIDDHIGPVLLQELHKSGQTSFLVYQDSPEHVVGTLYLRDAVQAREGGRVADLLHSKLMYVHEDFSLRQVLQAFVRTSQLMVVVINSFEEAVGVITVDRLLTELLGEHRDGEVMAYDDRASVAAFKRRSDEAAQPAAEAAAGTDSETPQIDDQPAEAPDPAPDVPPADSAPESTPAGGPSSPETTEVVE
jgi:CBS domain containing-hemolysin-like protein